MDAHVKKSYNRFGMLYDYTYLGTYVSVGIPAPMYEWILKRASEHLKHKINYHGKNASDYIWISAELPSDKTVECTAYSRKPNSKTTFGSLSDVISRLKSNVFGIGNFHIKVLKNQDGEKMLHFILNSFQILKTTSVRSYDFFNEEVSEDLSKLFNDQASI